MLWVKVAALKVLTPGLLALATVVLSFDAGAQPSPRLAAGRAAAAAIADCTCRNFGEDAPLGARLCIQTPQGQRVAVCVRSQNVTSWQPGEERCEEISLLSAPER